MRINVSEAGVLLFSALAIQCVSATPVTAAPVSQEEAPRLAAALLGHCHVIGTEKPGGAVKAAKGIHFTFAEGGKLHTLIETPVGAVPHEGTYRLDGRNIVADSPFGTLRVDDWSGQTLKLFFYRETKTFHCKKD